MYLFILPHQDDEFFIYPYIKYLKRRNFVVKIIYLTNGGYAKHDPLTRANESVAALSKININHEDIIFFGHDNSIYDAEIFYKYKIIADFLNSFFLNNINNIKKIIVPAWEGGHQDHDATNLIVQKITRKSKLKDKVFQFFLYNSYNISKPFFHVMTPISSKKYIKFNISLSCIYKTLSISVCYKSQWKTFLGLLPGSFFQLVFYRYIPIQKCNFNDLKFPPHEGLLLYERRGRFKYEIINKLMAYDF
jgi:hypothetical protein